MAERLVFFANEGRLWEEKMVSFIWASGMSKARRQQSLINLNARIREQYPEKKFVDISRYSLDPLGEKLSAFNLMVEIPSGMKMTVECAYQGSKVMKQYGKLDDLYGKTSMEAKKDPRHKDGALLRFELDGQVFDWGDPRTCFYNMLYIRALMQHPELGDELMKYDTFTDIMFSTDRATSCQARACAVYVSLRTKGLLEEAMKSKEDFKKIVYGVQY